MLFIFTNIHFFRPFSKIHFLFSNKTFCFKLVQYFSKQLHILIYLSIIMKFINTPFWHMTYLGFTAQKMKFSTKDFFTECDQIRRFLRIWSHLLEKSLMENFRRSSVYPLNSFWTPELHWTPSIINSFWSGHCGMYFLLFYFL